MNGVSADLLITHVLLILIVNSGLWYSWHWTFSRVIIMTVNDSASVEAMSAIMPDADDHY